jgi:hypothetical protein
MSVVSCLSAKRSWEELRQGLRDTRKRFWPFETRLNFLRKLDSVGELSFVELYRQTVQ